MDLARELSALAAHVDWPPTPELQAALEPRRRAAPPASARARPRGAGRRDRRRLRRAAVARRDPPLLPPRRRDDRPIVDRLPAAEERPLAAGIGPAVEPRRGEAGASAARLLVPPLDPLPPAHVRTGLGRVVRLLLPRQPVLLSEFAVRRGLPEEARGRRHLGRGRRTSRAIPASGSPGAATTSTSRTPRRGSPATS